MRFTRVSGPNAVLSGLFFDATDSGGANPGPGPGPEPAASVTFVSTDAATLGNWRGVYGQNGYWIIGDWNALPAQPAVSASAPEHIWNYDTADPSALEKQSSSTRIAACRYSSTAVEITVAASQVCVLSLYFLDWDNSQRQQQIDVIDAGTGAVLDTRDLSGFAKGVYLRWQISGDVDVRLSPRAGPNAVLSGIFLD